LLNQPTVTQRDAAPSGVIRLVSLGAKSMAAAASAEQPAASALQERFRAAQPSTNARVTQSVRFRDEKKRAEAAEMSGEG
jgi:hypothetical protein